MLAVRVIPLVLTDGVQAGKTRAFSAWRPLGSLQNVCRVYGARDVDELVVLDVQARRQGRTIDPRTVERIAAALFCPLTVGGGVRTWDHVRDLFNAGADKIALGPSSWDALPELSGRVGCQAFMACVNALGPQNGAVLAALAQKQGAGEILLQSIPHDGRMAGYDLELVRAVVAACTLPVVAGSGASHAHDAVEAVRAGADAVSAASLFHFTQTRPADVKAALAAAGFRVRPPFVERNLDNGSAKGQAEATSSPGDSA